MKTLFFIMNLYIAQRAMTQSIVKIVLLFILLIFRIPNNVDCYIYCHYSFSLIRFVQGRTITIFLYSKNNKRRGRTMIASHMIN
jgi:hypothetical protein